MHTVALRSLLRPESLGTAPQFIASWKDLRRFADRAHPFARNARVAPGRRSWIVCSEHDLCIEAQLKPSGELRCQHVIVIARTGRFMLKTILQLQLSMRRKTVGSRNVDSR